MSSPTRLNICSLGDPRDPGTWSGTPHHIASSLEEQNRLGSAFDVEAPRYLKAAFAAVGAVTLGPYDYQRQPLRRYYSAHRAAQETRNAASSATLHVFSLSLPFLRPPKGQDHYLFSDATWHLWTRGATDQHRYSDRFIQSAEKLELRAYRQLTHLFPIAEYVRQDLISHYGIPADDVTAVGTGLGLIRPFSGPKDYAGKKILFTAKGRFKDKGGLLAVEAFRIARARDPELSMTVVGCEDGLKLESEPGLTALGFVSAEKLQDLFETHTLFLLPAGNEPWGLVYLEAMACGMPIVGLNRNSFPEISGHGTFGSSPNQETPDALASLLLRMLSNPEQLREMGQRAQAHCVATYTWEATVNRILSVIDSRN